MSPASTSPTALPHNASRWWLLPAIIGWSLLLLSVHGSPVRLSGNSFHFYQWEITAVGSAMLSALALCQISGLQTKWAAIALLPIVFTGLAGAYYSLQYNLPAGAWSGAIYVLIIAAFALSFRLSTRSGEPFFSNAAFQLTAGAVLFWLCHRLLWISLETVGMILWLITFREALLGLFRGWPAAGHRPLSAMHGLLFASVAYIPAHAWSLEPTPGISSNCVLLLMLVATAHFFTCSQPTEIDTAKHTTRFLPTRFNLWIIGLLILTNVNTLGSADVSLSQSTCLRILLLTAVVQALPWRNPGLLRLPAWLPSGVFAIAPWLALVWLHFRS